MIIKLKYTTVIQTNLVSCTVWFILIGRRRRIWDSAELRDVFLTSLTLGKNYMEFVCKMESHIITLGTQVKKLKKKKH